MLKAAFSLMFGSLASKLLGLGREVLFAAWFGTTEIAAAYRIAQSLIFIFIHSIVGDTLAGTMLPIYQKLRAESEDKGRTLLAIAVTQGLLIGCVIGGAMFFFAHGVVGVLAPGASPSARSLAATMVQIMAIVAPVYIVGNTLAYIETAFGRYKALSSRTSLANVGIILAGGLAFYLKSPLVIAIGFVAVYVCFLGFTLYDFHNTGTLKTILGNLARPVLPILVLFEKNVLSLIGILIVSQGNVFAERVVASWLGTAVIPALDYARFLTDTVNVLLAVPLGIITMASHGASSMEDLRGHAGRTARALLLLTLPMSVFLLMGAKDIVAVVYQHGQFNAQSAAVTASILMGAAAGLFATVTGYFLIKSMNTALLNKESLLLTMLAAAVNVAFNLLTWRHLGPLTLGIGNSLFGVTLLLATITYLKLWKAALPMLAQGLAACALAVAALVVLPLPGIALLDLAIQGAVILAIWLGLYSLSPQTRQIAAPIAGKLEPVLKKLRLSRRS